jgi:hypothetical protein
MRPIPTWRRSTELAERRRTPRATLQWTVYLAFNGCGHPFRATTRDINKDGFYCSLDQPVKAGERIECDIIVPTHGSQDPDDVVCLRCCAQAVRVEKIEGSLEFGLACRIEDYSVIRSSGTLPSYRKDAGLVQNWSADPVKLLPN